MTRVIVGACALALLSGGAAACARSAGPVGGPAVHAAGTPARQVRVDARDLILNADAELQNLSSMRARADDAAVRDSIDRQMTSVRKWRDAVQADSTAPPGSPEEARLVADKANLERAIAAGAAAMPQAPSPPPLQRRDSNAGGAESFPPSR
jgi:hypothetical protein